MSLVSDVKNTIQYWWMYTLMGVLFVVTGIYVLTSPEESYFTLAMFFSIMVLINGLFNIAFSISSRKILSGWGWYLAGGILQVALGIILMKHPGITETVMPLILGFWLMFGGMSTISMGLDIKSFDIKGWGWIVFFGVLLMILSFIVIMDPQFGASSILVLTSIAFIIYGIGYIMLSLKLKKVKHFTLDKFKSFKKDFSKKFDDLKNQIVDEMKKAEASGGAKSSDVEQKFNDLKKDLEADS
ncbi:MAG: hypothetical protein BM564_08905 [Bacteroidetes bacterium MedPE-SWsnd-G2]|nr:MAG: hypothetical protein BM564_08905 [Bacteroidetes bacterium MedPE-SWsnd-G2]